VVPEICQCLGIAHDRFIGLFVVVRDETPWQIAADRRRIDAEQMQG
jgi:hypothetical protein